MADHRVDARQRHWGALDDHRPTEPVHTRANVFCLAARCNDTEAISRMLVDGVVATSKDATGQTAMHHAVSAGALSVVTLLATMPDAYVDTRDSLGKTPLHLAAHAGLSAVVRVLLEHDANINAIDDDQWSAAHFAASEGHLEANKCLISKDIDVLLEDRWHCFPSDVAERNGHTELAEFLDDVETKAKVVAKQSAKLKRGMNKIRGVSALGERTASAERPDK